VAVAEGCGKFPFHRIGNDHFVVFVDQDEIVAIAVQFGK
jgi:hypothetical protein